MNQKKDVKLSQNDFEGNNLESGVGFALLGTNDDLPEASCKETEENEEAKIEKDKKDDQE
ncbi:unnamed protein product [marine sediment metagenome]|uniref:Uncharacterized protein n=1 Tax=marine sediment metagenome TaxID=412755 RepID=X1CVX2_9ZZZZ